jgi:hypothetical protein
MVQSYKLLVPKSNSFFGTVKADLGTTVPEIGTQKPGKAAPFLACSKFPFLYIKKGCASYPRSAAAG